MSLKVHSRIIAALVLAGALAAAVPLAGAPSTLPAWEELHAAPAADDGRDVVEVALRDGKIYITVNQPVKVEVFTILGQLVASRSLKPGLTRLTLPHRGLYILKAGPVARRINI